MLDAVGLANLQRVRDGHRKVGKAVSSLLAPGVQRRRVGQVLTFKQAEKMDIKAGKPAPTTWDESRPWDWVYGAIVMDSEFWHTQVHGPALAWMAVDRGPLQSLSQQNTFKEVWTR